MKDRIENKMGMIRRVKDILGSNAAVLAVFSGLQNVINLFTAKVAELFDLIQEQDMSLKGITEDKVQIREKVVNEAFRVSNIVKAYADSVENSELFEEAHCTVAGLMSMRDDHLVIKLNNIYELANDNIGGIIPFGLTPGELGSYLSLVNEYTVWVQKPTEARSHRHNVTLRIDALMQEVNQLMKRRLDSAMAVIRTSHPMVYNDYMAARKTMNTGSRKKKPDEDPNIGYVFITVRAAADNVVLEGAKIFVDSVLADETDEDGEVFPDKILAGARKIRVECEGYVPYETEVNVEAGDELNLEVLLEAEIYDPDPDVNTEDLNE